MALRTRNILSLCAGVGGLELGIQLALLYRGEAGRGVCYVEREAAAAASLVASMEAGWFHPAPVWSDMRTFDARPWRGAVHILASGDPCQDNSVAGKRAGADGERFLAAEVTRVAEECRPDVVFRENVPGNAHEQLAAIAPPLEGMGYRVAAGIFSASGTGNTMRRERLFIMAVREDSDGWMGARSEDGQEGSDLAGFGGNVAGPLGLVEAGREPAAGEADGRRAFRQSGGSGRTLGGSAGSGPGEGSSMAGPGPWKQQVGEGDDGLVKQRSSLWRGAEQPAGAGAGGTDSHWGHPGRDGSDRSAASDGGADRAVPSLGGASRTEPQGQQRGQHHTLGRQVKGGHPLVSSRAVLPPAVIPGPTDSRWIDVLDRFPELQPALSEEEAQSHLRRGVDAVAHRVERLRATGNGVDPVAACTAWLSLGALLDASRPRA